MLDDIKNIIKKCIDRLRQFLSKIKELVDKETKPPISS
jgi:hypothetical protein